MVRKSLSLSLLVMLTAAACSSDDAATNRGGSGGGGGTADTGTGGSGATTEDTGTTDTGTTETDGGTTDTGTGACRPVYPNLGAAEGLQLGDTVRDLFWRGATNVGTQAAGDVDFYKLFENQTCADPMSTEAPIDTLAIIVVASWCQYCPAEIAFASRIAEEFKAQGGVFVVVNFEDTSGAPASNAEAKRFVTQHATINGIAPDNMWAVGDAAANPANYFHTLGEVTAFPSAYVVRLSDMKVVANPENAGGSYLNFVEIARDPNAGSWDPPTVPFTNNCGPNDEELTEPNDDAATATPVGIGSFTGGICSAAPDIYSITEAGAWTMTLTYDQSLGDIDMFVLDVANDRPVKDDAGADLISQETTGTESLSFTGPAYVAVYGYSSASAPNEFTNE